jgi:hypothetical protein
MFQICQKPSLGFGRDINSAAISTTISRLVVVEAL